MSNIVNSYPLINSYIKICPFCDQMAIIAVYGDVSQPDYGEHACTRCGLIWDEGDDLVQYNSQIGQTSYRSVPKNPEVYH